MLDPATRVNQRTAHRNRTHDGRVQKNQRSGEQQRPGIAEFLGESRHFAATVARRALRQ